MNRGILVAITIGVLAASFGILAQTAPETISIRRPVDRDFYAAARYIDVDADIDGDLVAAARRVTISSAVSGDVIAAGESITLRGQVEDDVRVAGRWIRLDAPIAGHLVAAGGGVDIGSGVTIGDWAWLAGQHIYMEGRLGRGLKAAGQLIVIRGHIGGDAELRAQRITIEPGAVIEGDLIWRADAEPHIADGARIGGQVVRKPHEPRKRADGGAGFGAVIIVAVIVAALVFHVLFLRFTVDAARATRSHFFASLGLGLAFCVAVPIAVLITMVTGIGALLALALLAIYLLGLLLGMAAALIAVGDAGLALARRPEARWGARLLSFAVAALLLVLVGSIPWIGRLALLIVWMTALGALLWTAGQRYRQTA